MRAIAEFRALNPGVWDAAHVSRVEVAMKESIGAAGRTGFYDRYGVVRDVMQNHLMEMLALLATDGARGLGAGDEAAKQQLRDAALAAARDEAAARVRRGDARLLTATAVGLLPGHPYVFRVCARTSTVSHSLTLHSHSCLHVH